MANKDFVNVADAISNIRLLKDDITNSKARRKFDKSVAQIKQSFDKLYYYAFFDYRFGTCNYNKLLEDIKSEDVKPKVKFIFIRVPGMIRAYYHDGQKKENILNFINVLKNKIKDENKKFHYKNVYTIDNFIILVVEKEYIEEVYYSIKEIKNDYNLDLGIHYVKYENTSAKVSKNIENCINVAIKVTKEKIHDEKSREQ